MRNRFDRAVSAMVLCVALACAGGDALAQSGDERIIAAREAFRTGDRTTLERLAAHGEDHPLAAYPSFWLLQNRLARPEPSPVAEIEAFLANNAGTVVAERLRMSWLKKLSDEGDWTRVIREHAALARPDDASRCMLWRARLENGDRSVVSEVSAQWLDFHIGDDEGACNDLLRSLAARGLVDEAHVWQRFRRQIDSRNPGNAKTTATWLPAGQAPTATAIDQLIKSPAQALDRLPANFAATRSGRELALAALTRVAREDPVAAQARLTRISDRLSADERAHVHAVLGYHGALSRLPQANEWYRAAGNIPLSPEHRAWRVRAALRGEHWKDVDGAILSLPEAERSQPEWVYWRARALSALGRDEDARRLYRQIADRTDFYGLLASEELGNLFQPPPAEPAARDGDKARALADPGIVRALALYRLEMTTEGVREWAWAVRGKDDAFLAGAARVALELGLYDRAINTAELGSPNANFSLRYITPFRELVEPHVHNQNLDMAWVYGLMRQESRFIVPARSSAGAQGLMQVMPATGKWVAGKIGLAGYKPSMLNDPDTNVLLGTNYMRLIMEDLDSHPVLASAGYNAGPGRAKRWRDFRPLEGTIYTETIPIEETRDYVKKVLANAVIYAAMLQGSPQSLKARLGVIAPQ